MINRLCAFLFTILVSLNVLANNEICDSAFIAQYKREYVKQKPIMTLLTRIKTLGCNWGTDKTVLIPTLVFKRTVVSHWDYFNSLNNTEYANWSFLKLRRMAVEDIIAPNNHEYWYIKNGGFRNKPRFRVLRNDDYGGTYHLIWEKYREMNPDMVFRIYGLPAWFFIKDNSIIVFERNYSEIIRYDDALQYLKERMLTKDFWPTDKVI